MNSIQNPSLSAGLAPGYTALSDTPSSSYVRKQSLNVHESLDAGLTIKTKDGDLVTLISNTYSDMDAFMYDSQGVLQTESGRPLLTQNQREVSLASGDSFLFSVVGELSEEELGDIDAIVKGIDEIISKVAQGDMDDAIAKALSMDGYDTISMYSADISYQKSYAMRSETLTPMPGTQGLQKDETAVSSVKELFSENRSRMRKNKSTHYMSNLFEKLAEKLETHDEKLIDRAKKPIDKLFRHHLKEMKDNEDNAMSNAIERVRSQIAKWIEKMPGSRFEDQFSGGLHHEE